MSQMEMGPRDLFALPVAIHRGHHHDRHLSHSSYPPSSLHPVAGALLALPLLPPLPAHRLNQSQADQPLSRHQTICRCPDSAESVAPWQVSSSPFSMVGSPPIEAPSKTTASAYEVSPRLEGGVWLNDQDLVLNEGIAPAKPLSNQGIGIDSGTPNTPEPVISHRRGVSIDAEARDESDRKGPSAVRLLMLLSLPVPILSLVTASYTLIALVGVAIVSPLRCCPPSPFFRMTSFAVQLNRLLVPAWRLHQCAVGSTDQNPDTRTFSTTPLVCILLLSPLVSLGLLLATWTAAAFWIFVMVLGDPNGTERKDDGRAAILSVNAWWQKWLGYSRHKR